jgi:hypothetical protein
MSAEEGGNGAPEGGVPPAVQQRLDRVTEQRRAAEAKASELENKVAALTEKATRYDDAVKELGAWKAKEAAWGEEKSVMGAGITDPDGVDFARHAWSRVPEDKRPAGGIGEWLQGRDALPKAVQAYFPAVAAPPTASNAPPPIAHGLPPSNNGVAQAQPAGGKLSVEQIRTMSLQDMLTNLPEVAAGRR